MQFKGYFQKFPDGDLLSIFSEWCGSKDIEGKDKHYIWKIVRHFKQNGEKEIFEGEDSVRLKEIIEKMFGADLERLKRIVDKNQE